MLGSASWDLLQQWGEALGRRISHLDTTGLTVPETGADLQDSLWLRGGFPDGVQSPSEPRSLGWRETFIRTNLEHDTPQFGPRMAVETLRRLWTMLAHQQGA